MRPWRIVVAALVAGAAVGALLRSANAGPVGRVAGVTAVAALVAVGAGVYRERRWAHGSAFFLGLFWLWAGLALRIQGVMGSPEIFVWLAWSLAVIGGSVRARAD